MTAKEKQTTFIKTYLKPVLKLHGYSTSGQTWWKDKGDFFSVINLQNYSWNSKDSVDFRFNVGIALTALLEDKQKRKATYNDLVIHLDEGAFLPDRKSRKFGNNQGYSITAETDLNEFISAFKSDWETNILPKLDEPNSLQDCVQHYGQLPFWGERLKMLIVDSY